MYRRPVSNSTLISRGLLTLVIWLLALMVLNACSTSIQFTAEQQYRQKAAAKPASSAEQKKQQFFAFLKPMVIAENEKILHQRRQVRELKSKGELNSRELIWLQQLARQYKVALKEQPTDANWQALLDRVDVIPVEMALIQAANESAWGQSRFAKQGNNYFGQWCYTKGCGLVPRRRAAGATHEVRRFGNARESVASYMRNINTTKAYAEFRQIRHSLRVQSRPLEAELLIVGLKAYSERGMEYVRIIRSMIRSNRKLIELS